MDSPRDNPVHRSLAIARGVLLPIGLFSLVINLLVLGVPLYMMQVYDRVLTSGSLATLGWLTLLALSMLLVMALLDVCRSAIAIKVSGWLGGDLAPQALAQAIATALRRQDYTTEALRDLATLRAFLGGASLFVLFDAFWAPLYLIVIFLLHPWLGLIALIGSLILLTLAWLNERLTRAPLRAANDLWTKGLRQVEVAARNAEAVVGMGMTEGITARWLAGNGQVLALQQAASRRSTMLVAATKAIRLTLQIAMLGAGALLVLDQRISPGSMIAASIIMSRALAPVEQAIGTWRQIVDYSGARDRLLRFFALPALPRGGLALPAPECHLAVESVTYLPPGVAEPVLRRVSFEARPGEVLAVLGPSAAGKSSLARLVVATAKPTAGVVRLDGADVYGWPRADLGRHVGYLPQEVSLFAGSVRDNIARLGEAADEDVVTAARLAGVHEMILRLPEGYRTEIGDGGARLSAGQRQRLALARAVFGSPRLVVLDEPNANLDSDGELALARALLALKQAGATTIVISHRQSILMQADKILLLRAGMVERFGSRTEVLQDLASRRRDLPAAAAPPDSAILTERKAAQ
ncbi:MAG: type I secretion system permease/ATPase [Alphaproteobacteria bacterium]